MPYKPNSRRTNARPRRVPTGPGTTALQAPVEYAIVTAIGDLNCMSRMQELHDAGWIVGAPIVIEPFHYPDPTQLPRPDVVWKVIAWRFRS